MEVGCASYIYPLAFGLRAGVKFTQQCIALSVGVIWGAFEMYSAVYYFLGSVNGGIGRYFLRLWKRGAFSTPS